MSKILPRNRIDKDIISMIVRARSEAGVVRHRKSAKYYIFGLRPQAFEDSEIILSETSEILSEFRIYPISIKLRLLTKGGFPIEI